MQMEGEGGREEGEREMCCLEEIHSAEERRQTASMSICLFLKPLNFKSQWRESQIQIQAQALFEYKDSLFRSNYRRFELDSSHFFEVDPSTEEWSSFFC